MHTFKLQVWRTFGRSLREARERQGLTQEEVATSLLRFGSGGTQSSIAKMERGERTVAVDQLVALAWVLKVEANKLLPLVVDPKDEHADLVELMAERDRLAAELLELQDRRETVERQLQVVKAAPQGRVVLLPTRGGDNGEHSEEA